MNCIFICVFNQSKYVDMFYLLLESILLYGNLNHTHILVYTSTPFMNQIKQNPLWNETIVFEIKDTYHDINTACKARLDLFNLPSVSNYKKILYLDTDILVKNDINKVFDVCKKDILYVLEEGNLTDGHDYYGEVTLFGNEIHKYRDKSAFTSGILLFNNCKIIKDLFQTILEDIQNRPFRFSCYDQPYIVYNAFHSNLYDNKVLKSLVVNNDTNIQSNKVIHHFPGGTGIYQHKIHAMTQFLNRIQINLKGKTYTWENSYIHFLDNFKMDAFGEGYYESINKHTIIARFGGRIHAIKFNENYTSFVSTRNDLQIRIGKIH